MRLSRQITLLVTLLLLLVLLATAYISIHGSRQYLIGQMQVQAQDAGSSLAMSLSPILAAGEVALAGAMLDSTFERGFYQSINIQDLQGEVIVKRQLPIVVQGVPEWFVNLTKVQSPRVQSPVMQGIDKIAVVEVATHPGKAYRAMWQITVANLKWISAVAIVGIIIVCLIVRMALRPLAQVRQQAEEIARQNYVIQHQFPYATELKQLVVSMNDMAEKLENFMSAQIDQVIELANKVHTDPGTGVLSREGFDERMNRLIDSNQALGGQLFLIRISGLDRVNQFFSYKRGNEELKKVLMRLKELSEHEWGIARLSGADMVVFILDDQGVGIQQRCQELVQALNAVSEDLRCHIGGVSISAAFDKEGLLYEANQALQKALEEEKGWYVL